MQTTVQIAAAALAAVLSCTLAAKPFPDPHFPARPASWLDKPTLSMNVRWVRGDDLPQSEVRDGVCVVYMPDRDESSLIDAERLIHKCAATPGLREGGPLPGTVWLYWHQVTSAEAIASMRAELYPYGAAHRNAGYYYHPTPSGPCHVITNVNRQALGHELKHCFDGEFHTSIPSAFGRETVWRKK